MSTSLGATPPQSSHRSTAWSSRSCHATLSRPLNLPSVLTTSAARRSWTQWQPVNVHATDRPFGGARKKLNFYRRGRAENGRHSSQTPRLGRLEGWNTRADSPSGPAVARACATQTTPTRRSRSSTHWSTNLKGTTLQHTIGAPCMRRVSLLTSTLSVRHATRCLRWRRCNRRGWQSACKAEGGEAAQTDLWVGRWVRRAYLERVHLSHQLLERACVHV